MTYLKLLLFCFGLSIVGVFTVDDPDENFKILEYALHTFKVERDLSLPCDFIYDYRDYYILKRELSNSFEFIIVANVVPIGSSCRRKLDESEIFYPSTCRFRVSTAKYDGHYFWGGFECKKGLSYLRPPIYRPPYYGGRGYYGPRYGARYGPGGYGPGYGYGASALGALYQNSMPYYANTNATNTNATAQNIVNPFSGTSFDRSVLPNGMGTPFDFGFFTENPVAKSLFSGSTFTSPGVRIATNVNPFVGTTFSSNSLLNSRTSSSGALTGISPFTLKNSDSSKSGTSAQTPGAPGAPGAPSSGSPASGAPIAPATPTPTPTLIQPLSGLFRFGPPPPSRLVFL